MAADLTTFLQIHEPQLKSIDFPTQLYETLYNLMKNGSNGLIEENFHLFKVKNSRSMLQTKQPLANCGSCYISPHIWSSDGSGGASKDLSKDPKLADRLAEIFGVPPKIDVEEFNNYALQRDVVEKVSGCTKEKVKQAVESCDGDTIMSLLKLDDNAEDIKRDTKSKSSDCTYEEFKSALQKTGNLPAHSNEAYLQKMYESFMRNDHGSASTSVYNWTDDGTVTVYVLIPLHVKKKDITSKLCRDHWSLCIAGKTLLDGDLYKAVKVDESYWSIEAPGLFCMTLEKCSHIVVWSELLKDENQLSSSQVLQQYWSTEKSNDVYHKAILDTMWKYNQTYCLPSPGKRKPTWYVMDEYGSAITHDGDPNLKCSPFYFVPEKRFFSLFWPIKDVQEGMRCTRNFILPLSANETKETRLARMKAFVDRRISCKGKEEKPFENGVNVEEIIELTRLSDTNEKNCGGVKVHVAGLPEQHLEKITQKLNLISVSKQDADIKVLSLNESIINISGELIPTEEVIASRMYLQIYFQYRLAGCDWLSHGWILPRDLVSFNEEFEKSFLPVYWVLKSSSKRSVDMKPVICSQYSRIARMSEVGPIELMKYISSQLLYRGRLFTLCYNIVIAKPSSVYVHCTPFIRLAAKPFESKIIDEYDSSFTLTSSSTHQDEGIFEDFKASMNKLLLPINHERDWNCLEGSLLKKIGYFAAILSNDVRNESRNLLVFSVDVVLGNDFSVHVVDVNDVCNLPNQSCIEDILKLATGVQSSAFVKVELSQKTP